MLRSKLDIPVAALAACLRWENLSDGHPVIAEPPVWRNGAAKRASDDAARTLLGTHGLLQDGRLDPDFRDTLRVLAAPSVEYSCWARDRTGTSSALVASIGKDAVLALRNSDELHLAQIDPQRQAEELVALLPDASPARAQTINARRADYEVLRAAETHVLHSGSDNAAARRLYDVLQQARECAAEFHVATRDRAGVRHRGGQRTMIDTAQGRWLITLRPGRSADDDWIVAAPASRRDLANALYQMREPIG